MQHFIEATFRALGFLTRLPLPDCLFRTESSIAGNAGYFPIAGLCIGVSGCLVMTLAFWMGFSSLAIALFTIVTIIIITGALHEDGLSDTADAFFAHQSVERRLEIMKDSHIGVYGTLALVLSVLARVILLSDIVTKFGLFNSCLALIMIETASRAGMVYFWYKLPLARKNGTAAKAGKPDNKQNKIAISFGLGFFILLGIFSFGIWASLLAMILSFLFIKAFSALCIDRIGGYTGDTLGAIQQCLTIIMALALYIGSS